MLNLLNSFSLQMLPQGNYFETTIKKLSLEEAVAMVTTWSPDVQSYIGHQDTATLLTSMLGVDIPCNRENIKLTREPLGNNQFLVAQITGGRLPEGCTTLPEGVQVEFFTIELDMYTLW